MKGRRVILWLALALLAAAGLRALYPGDEARIRKRLLALAERASFAGGGKPLSHLAAAGAVADFFAPEFAIELEAPGWGEVHLTTRPELVQAVVAARSQGRSARFQLLDLRISVDPGGESATAEATVRVESPETRDPFVTEARFLLQKRGRTWFVRRIESQRTFARAVLRFETRKALRFAIAKRPSLKNLS